MTQNAPSNLNEKLTMSNQMQVTGQESAYV